MGNNGMKNLSRCSQLKIIYLPSSAREQEYIITKIVNNKCFCLKKIYQIIIKRKYLNSQPLFLS